MENIKQLIKSLKKNQMETLNLKKRKIWHKNYSVNGIKSGMMQGTSGLYL
jgi:hypothetical protein